METLLTMIAKIKENPMASGIVLAALVGWAGFVTNKLPNVLVSLISRLFVNRLIYEGTGTYDQSRAFDTAMQFFDKMEPNRIFAGGASPSLRSAYEAAGTKKSLLGPRFGGLYTVKISNTRIFFRLIMDGYSNFGRANMRLTVYVPVWASLSKINDEITGTNELTVHYIGHCHTTLRTAPRPLETCIMPDNIAEMLVDRITTFLSERERYYKNGQQHKLVIMLHGPHGTGKTSLVAGLASYFRQDLSIIDLASIDSNTLLQNCTSGFMVVEEVDAAQVSLKDDADVAAKNDGKNVGRALFWQWLSGNVPHSNSVIFLTTNHIDRLDPGLLRDARVDISVYVGRWGVAELQRYLAMQFTDRPPLWFNSLGSLKRTESAKDEEMPVGSAIQALVDKTTPEHVLDAVCQKYPVTYDMG